jgi:hypothetical protein
LLPSRTRPQLRRETRRPVWGNRRRLTPLSASFGFGRGTPIDRYYLRRFLLEERDAGPRCRRGRGTAVDRYHIETFLDEHRCGIESNPRPRA